MLWRHVFNTCPWICALSGELLDARVVRIVRKTENRFSCALLPSAIYRFALLPSRPRACKPWRPGCAVLTSGWVLLGDVTGKKWCARAVNLTATVGCAVRGGHAHASSGSSRAGSCGTFICTFNLPCLCLQQNIGTLPAKACTACILVYLSHAPLYFLFSTAIDCSYFQLQFTF